MADILLVDDQDRTADLCRRTLPEHRWRGPARSWREASEALARGRGRIDLVLLDVHFELPAAELVGATDGMSGAALQALRDRQGLEILKEIRRRYPELPVVLMTAQQDSVLDRLGGDVGADETTYFLDDDYVDARSLAAQIETILAARRGQIADGPVFWGRSLPMRRMRQRLEVLARGRLPVVLLGPTGTGKSLLARHFVHPRSGRAGRFVSVDLATVPSELMAAHLFGSVKGSYTGAVADRVGAFEAAHEGTLFLDEIGNLSADAQKMLLSVLQEGTVTRVGDVRERPVDVKLVVATNEDLGARVRAGTFRGDLLMRLNPAAALTLPPLGARAVDLDELLAFCVEDALKRPALRGLMDDYRNEHGLRGQAVRVVQQAEAPDEGVLQLLFPDRARRLLRRHPWPGNLREFSMVVENAVMFALSELLEVAGAERADVVQVRPSTVRDLLATAPLPDEAADASAGLGFSVVLEPGETLNDVAREVERQYFELLWTRHDGDFGAMARVLLGDEAHARKVQLRFNQLGLKVRDMRSKLA